MDQRQDQFHSDEPPPYAPGESVGPPPVVRPAIPERPPRSPGQQVAGTFFSLLTAVAGLAVLAAMLFFCTGGNAGVILLIAGIFAFTVVHYLLWGWWLSARIRRKADAEPDSQHIQ